jgi:hypothetical protein
VSERIAAPRREASDELEPKTAGKPGSETEKVEWVAGKGAKKSPVMRNFDGYVLKKLWLTALL